MAFGRLVDSQYLNGCFAVLLFDSISARVDSAARSTRMTSVKRGVWMETYRCPVCNKPLTKREYEKALKIEKSKEAHLHHLEQQLKKDQRELVNKIKQAQKEAQLKANQKAVRLKNELKRQADAMKRMKHQTNAKIEEATKEGERKGIKKNTQMMLGLKHENEKLKRRIDQLRKGTTPQTEGLEDEPKLTARLKKEFPEDIVEHKGKGGDVLQIVRFKGKEAGLIIYECKRTPTILAQHIRQAFLARQSRKADFAVLVTTGKMKGFSGFLSRDGVFIVDPRGVLSFVPVLREHLIGMLRAKITKEERAKLAQKLMKYIDSPQFKNPIEEVIHLSTELEGMVKTEFEEHRRVWIKRLQSYRKIKIDNSQVQDNLQLVLHGKEPRPILSSKLPALQLPAALTPR
jgi:hypothetical protein